LQKRYPSFLSASSASLREIKSADKPPHSQNGTIAFMKALAATAIVIAFLGVGVGAYFLVNKPAPPSEAEYGPLPEPIAKPSQLKPLELPQGVAPINGIEAVFKRKEAAIRATKNESELRELASQCQGYAFDVGGLPPFKSPPYPLEAQSALVRAFEYLSLAAKISLTSDNPEKAFKAARESMDKARKLGS